MRSQSERLGRQPIPLRCEFRSECVGCEAVCLLAPAPSAAPLHPRLPRSPQTLLIRPLDFCHQGSRGGCVALCVILGLQTGKQAREGQGAGAAVAKIQIQGSQSCTPGSIGPRQLGHSWLGAAHSGRTGPGRDLYHHPFSRGCSA